MPYIVTTRYADCMTPRECGECDISRLAFYTLEETRNYMRPILESSYPHGPAGNRAALRDLEGFSPILLEDGTVIEVERLEWAANYSPLAAVKIIEAFNAAQRQED